MEQLQFTVHDSDSGRRLDAWLAEQSDRLTRSQVQKAILQGHVHVNGAVPKPSLPVAPGDLIAVDLPDPVPLQAASEDIPLDILFEDDWVAVINKPEGMVVHPACGNYTGTLVNALLHHCSNLSGIGGVIRPGIVHRLDKGTSGILVVAKSDAAHHGLSAQFKSHNIIRRYRALVFGSMPENSGTVRSLIGRHISDRKKMSIQTRRGREAVTHWRVIEQLGGITLVEAELETGRTHQVRVHLASLNHPVVGDITYGASAKMKQIASKRLLDLLRGVERPLLHACHLAFRHPGTGETMSFDTSPPRDFERVVTIARSWHA